MSETFYIYQEQIKTNFAEVIKRFDSIEKCESLSSKKEIIKQISFGLENCDKLIKTLELQIITEEPNDTNFELYVQNYKSGLLQYRTKYLKEKEKVETEEQVITLTPRTEASTPRDITNETIALNSFNILEQAKRATIEIEHSGNSIMIEMNSQTDKMKSTTNKVNKMNDQISDSTNLITEMEATNRKNNRIIYIFSLGLIVAFCLILASKIYPIMRASQSTEQTVQ